MKWNVSPISIRNALSDRGLLPENIVANEKNGTLTLSATGKGDRFTLADARDASRIILTLGTYSRIRGRAHRIGWLSQVHSEMHATSELAVHANIPLGGGTARLFVDAPLGIGNRFLSRAIEAGDRFSPHYEHLFFDERSLVEELREAGFTLIDREDIRYTFSPRAPKTRSLTPAITLPREIALLTPLLPQVERMRLREGPLQMIEWARERGMECEARDLEGRVTLRSAIAWLDATFPTGPNCLRRVLAEVASDRGAAGQQVVIALDVEKTGHAWLRSIERPAEIRYDVEFVL